MISRRRFLDLVKGAAVAAAVPAAPVLAASSKHDGALADSQKETSFDGKIDVDSRKSTSAWPHQTQAPKGAPNIVVILLDDAGYGATSTFGGPVETPVLSHLATTGLRYSRFHVTALCSPTRSSLLSGRNCHRMGFGGVMETVSGYPGYDGIWKKEGASIPQVLRKNGYSTAAFGKWHNTPYWELRPTGPFDRWPTTLGFDHFYGFMMGEGSAWEPDLFRNCEAIPRPATPKEGYYLTTDLVDQAIDWVHTQRSLAPEKPYFLYFAPGATHAPHHVPKEWIGKFKGKFDDGWDKLREATFARQKSLGIIPQNTELTQRPAEIPAWDALSVEERTLYTRQMEIYAAYLACTDAEIDRLLNVVRSRDKAENTLVFYIAGDNGASADDGLTGLRWQAVHRTMADRLANIDELGGPSEENAYAAGWAWAMDTPFKWTKRIASHFGGTRDPLIVSWPARIKGAGQIRSQFGHVNDIAPTIYEAAGIQFPTAVDGVKQMPLDGTSLVYSFDQPDAPSRHRIQVFEQMGNRAIYQDGWIAAARHINPWTPCPDTTYEQDSWELYHIDEDFSEANDLAEKYPERLAELKILFDSEAKENNIYPLGAGICARRRSMGGGALLPPRTNYVFTPDLPLMHSLAGPDFTKSHHVSAEVDLPDNPSGILLSVGTRFAGFAMFVRQHRLIYQWHSLGNVATLFSDVDVPQGTTNLEYLLADGMGQLLVDGRPVSEPRKIPISPITEGHFNIGRGLDSPVGEGNVAPFEFNGIIKQVTVNLTES